MKIETARSNEIIVIKNKDKQVNISRETDFENACNEIGIEGENIIKMIFRELASVVGVLNYQINFIVGKDKTKVETIFFTSHTKEIKKYYESQKTINNYSKRYL